ncbi:MAG: hypothetical protein HOA66_04330 [Candidatus Marinimicrobia bacterium]|nr:hypothetical protein [Candidatus Neomarinimicrobiota bacterium]
MYRIAIIILISAQFIQAERLPLSCILENTRDYNRVIFSQHEVIDSTHFRVHFTIAEDDSINHQGEWLNPQTNVTYAESVLIEFEYSAIILQQRGWTLPPPDCDESITDELDANHCINFGGDSRYDIYLTPHGPGFAIPDRIHNIEPYTAGRTSYIFLSTMANMHETYPSWGYYAIAHELHHAIQIAYAVSTTGSVGEYSYNAWFFEESASYIENVVYPNAVHLQTMLGNCNVTTPLTYPDYDLNSGADLYQYRGALWLKFLVEAYGDSSIIKTLWDDYGLTATTEGVDMFRVYSDAVEGLENVDVTLSEAYTEYGIWRYFTGGRAMPNRYFEEANQYCTSTTTPLTDEILNIRTEWGSTYILELPSVDTTLNIFTPNPIVFTTNVLTITGDTLESSIPLIIENEETSFQISPPSNGSQFLLVTSGYSGNPNVVNPFYTFESSSLPNGDVNNDDEINVLDVVILVQFVLQQQFPDDNQFYNGDLNSDGQLNVLDVVQLLNVILAEN